MVEQELIEKYGKYVPGMSVLFPVENWMNFTTHDGISLHTYKYPCKNPKAVAVLFHGMHSYSQPSGIIGKSLSEYGCEVLAYDQRGHGKSQGIKGYFPSMSVLIKDATDFLSEVNKLYPGLQLFLVGGSMGGLIVLTLAIKLQSKLDGIILINPALGLNTSLEGFLRCLTSCLSSCMPKFGIVKGEKSLSTQNQALHQYMEENPYYYHGKARLGSSAALLKGMKAIRSQYTQLNTPVLVVQGSKDYVISVERVNEFMKVINVPDKTILMYPGLPHSIVFEEAILEISTKIAHWVADHYKYS